MSDHVTARASTRRETRGDGHVLDLSGALALPVVDGEVPFGRRQQPVLPGFDTRPRERRVVVTVTGEGG